MLMIKILNLERLILQNASTADGGGVTLKGTTDKTILYEYDTQSWDSNLDCINKTTDDSRLVIDSVQI